MIRKTKGYSGADIANVCREAAMMPMRRKILEGGLNFDEISKINHEELDVPITNSDFTEALKNIQKSVSQGNLDEYQKWMAELAFIRAKHLATCIMERANMSLEEQQNKDGISADFRPPLSADVDLFSTR